MENSDQKEVEALCPECGHGFKAYMDRVLNDGKGHRDRRSVECPVCGCGDCKIGE
ncbi:MAG: hypothetical protein ABIK98_00335 [Pseudomonadota bacterium]|uniref:Uncharacterized protein n=1 Tax=Candidatus Desulfatibia profunda TaxID=2841695 RepID=A0A8J6NSL0_9BACT|nr:hypothetical protein [Candidatus Desulfatibia profunda]